MAALLPLRINWADKYLPTNLLSNAEMIYKTISTQGHLDHFAEPVSRSWYGRLFVHK